MTAGDAAPSDSDTKSDPDDRDQLDKAYAVDDPEATRQLYADWASHYDTELAKNGYVTPGRCAQALAEHDPSRKSPVIDLGCGTGLSGLALRAAGFETVDGLDFSAEMLAEARKTGAYRTLIEGDVLEPATPPEGAYAHAVAAGVFSPGHAPPEGVDAALALIETGGLFVFSLNQHALDDPAYLGRISNLVDCGAAELLFKIHNAFAPQLSQGDHHFFEGLTLVKRRNADPNEPPVYEVMTGS